MADQSLTFEELRQRWKVSERTLRRKIATNGVPRPFKVGSLLRWRMGDVENYERRQVEVDPSLGIMADIRDRMETRGDEEVAVNADDPAAWKQLRKSLERLDKLDSKGIDELIGLAMGLDIDGDRLELFSVAAKIHAENSPIANDLKKRRSANAQSHNGPVVPIFLPCVGPLAELRERTLGAFSAANHAVKVLGALDTFFPELFGQKPPEAPLSGQAASQCLTLLAPIYNKFLELGISPVGGGIRTFEDVDDDDDDDDSTWGAK